MTRAASAVCVSVQGEMNKLIIIDAPPNEYTLYVHGVRNDIVWLPVCRRATVCDRLYTRSPTTVPVAYTVAPRMHHTWTRSEPVRKWMSLMSDSKRLEVQPTNVQLLKWPE